MTRSDPRPDARQQAGHSLLEMAIALLIFMVAISIAAGLLGASQRQAAAAGQRSLDPALSLTLHRLRFDIMDARGASGQISAGWTHAPLDLHKASGERVRYALLDGVLTRQRIPVSGAVAEQQVHPNVLTFRWRTATGPWRSIVEVELVDRVRRLPLHAGKPVEARTRRQGLRVAMRAPGGRSW